MPLWGGLDGSDQVLEHPVGRPWCGFVHEVGTQALVEVLSFVHAVRPSVVALDTLRSSASSTARNAATA